MAKTREVIPVSPNTPVTLEPIRCVTCDRVVGYMPRPIDIAKTTQPLLYCSKDCAEEQFEAGESVQLYSYRGQGRHRAHLNLAKAMGDDK
jgi:hypothetical protein